MASDRLWEVPHDNVVHQSPTSSNFESISAGDVINLQAGIALARSSIHQPTTSLDTMDLACPSTVNPNVLTPHIYKRLCTEYLMHY